MRSPVRENSRNCGKCRSLPVAFSCGLRCKQDVVAVNPSGSRPLPPSKAEILSPNPSFNMHLESARLFLGPFWQTIHVGHQKAKTYASSGLRFIVARVAVHATTALRISEIQNYMCTPDAFGALDARCAKLISASIGFLDYTRHNASPLMSNARTYNDDSGKFAYKAILATFN